MSSVQSISLSHPKFKRFLKKSTALTTKQINFYCHNHKVYERSLKRLAAAVDTKSPKQICRMQNNLGNSMSAARTMTLIEIYKKETNPKTKSKANAPKVTHKEIEEVAKEVKFFTKTLEKHKKGVISSNSKKRPILMAGPILSTRAQIAADIWINIIGRNEYDYSNKGLSTHKAIEKVIEYIDSGYKYWVYLDIKDAYSSVRRSHLKEMTVVSNSVVSVLIPTTDTTSNSTTPIEAPQPSLPQGIAASSRIMSAFVGHHFRSLAEMNVVYMSYVDDILIGARTLEEVEIAKETLIKSYKDCKSGALHFGKVEIVDLNYRDQFLNFVGYGINVDYFTKEVRVRPNMISFQKFYHELLDRLDKSQLLGLALYDMAYKYSDDWRRSFKMWSMRPITADLIYIKVDEIVDEFVSHGCSKANVIAFHKYNSALLKASPTDSALREYI